MAKSTIAAMRIATMVVLVGSMAGTFAISVMPVAPAQATEPSGLGAIAPSTTVTGSLSFTSNGAIQAYTHTTGNGTAGNPYVIQDLLISATGSPALVFSGISVHVVFKNSLVCTITGGTNGVVISGCVNVTMQNCQIIGFQVGVGVVGSSKVAVLGNTITASYAGIQLSGGTTGTLVGENVISSPNCGIYADGASQNTIRGNWIYNATSGGYNAGIALLNTCPGNVIIGNHIESCMIGILSATNSQANRFSSNTILRCTTGVYFTGSNGATADGNRITNMSQYGIWITTGTTNITITGNTIESCANPGILVDAPACNILYNLIRFCGTGIVLITGRNGNHVVGNVMLCMTCLVVQSEYNTVTGNDFETSSTEIGISGTLLGNLYDEDGFGNFYARYTTFYPVANKSADGRTWTTPWTAGMGVYADNHPLVNRPDSDGDGLTNYQELLTHHTLADDADTDDDGANDGAEIAAGSNPFNVDTDGDGATDGDEIRIGTDPLNAMDLPWFGFKPWIFLALFVGIPAAAVVAGAIAIKARQAKDKRASKTSRSKGNPSASKGSGSTTKSQPASGKQKK